MKREGMKTGSKTRAMKGEGIKTGSKARAMKGREIKMLPAKQMLQRLLILLEQVKAGNISENVVNEIRQIVHSLHP